MKSRSQIALLLGVFVLFSWACSSSKVPPKTINQPPPAPVQEKQPAEPTPQEQPQEQKEAPQVLEWKEVAPELQNQETEALTGKEEPPVILEEALKTYQEALVAWERGCRGSNTLGI